MKRRKKYLNPKIIGVTGGIGSGQSTVCDELQRLGNKVINVDKKAKEVIRKDKTVQQEIKREFGKHVFYRNGQLNKKLLAKLVFDDEGKVQ